MNDLLETDLEISESLDSLVIGKVRFSDSTERLELVKQAKDGKVGRIAFLKSWMKWKNVSIETVVSTVLERAIDLKKKDLNFSGVKFNKAERLQIIDGFRFLNKDTGNLALPSPKTSKAYKIAKTQYNVALARVIDGIRSELIRDRISTEKATSNLEKEVNSRLNAIAQA